MATETFFIATYSAGRNCYVRVMGTTGADLGKVLDFDDNTFKTLGTATTPYAPMAEQTDWDGPGLSGYTVLVNLANVNSSSTLKRYLLKVFDNVAPAITDVAISPGGRLVTVRDGNLLESGDPNVLADNVLDRTDGVETGYTLRESQRIQLAVLGGKLSGAGTGTEVFRDANDTKNRVTATVDGVGNRSVVTKDAT